MTGDQGPGQPLVEVDGLVVDVGEHGGERKVTRVGPVSFEIERGSCLGIVGRSGAGKSTLAVALLGMVPPLGRRVEGSVTVAGRSLFDLDERQMRQMRGKAMAMIFQDPSRALNPVRRLDRTFADVVLAHDKCDRRDVRDRSEEALRKVRLDPGRVLRHYPHELSGGMRQRVLVALAIVNAPDLLIADEPTTALDPTIQLEVLDLLADLRRSNTLVVITHDLRVARRLCDTVAVMDRGVVVEHGPASDVLVAPRSEVTRNLLADEEISTPRRPAPAMSPAREETR